MRSTVGSVWVVLFALFCCSPGLGDTLSPTRVNWDLSSFAMDIDYVALPVLLGLDTTVNSTAYSCSADGWSASTGGSYQGSAVAYQYTGLFNVEDGEATWSGDGTIGTTTMVSSGMGTLTGDTLTTSGSGSLGDHTWSWQGVFNYNSDLSSLAGPMTYTLDGVTGSGGYSLHHSWWVSNVTWSVWWGLSIVINHQPDGPPPPDVAQWTGMGDIVAVPEPGTLSMLTALAGIGICAYVCHWRK